MTSTLTVQCREVFIHRVCVIVYHLSHNSYSLIDRGVLNAYCCFLSGDGVNLLSGAISTTVVTSDWRITNLLMVGGFVPAKTDDIMVTIF